MNSRPWLRQREGGWKEGVTEVEITRQEAGSRGHVGPPWRRNDRSYLAERSAAPAAFAIQTKID